MSDEMLRPMAENGGVVQLTMLSSYLRDIPENPERDAAIAAPAGFDEAWSEMTDKERAAMRAAFGEINKQFPAPSANASTSWTTSTTS